MEETREDKIVDQEDKIVDQITAYVNTISLHPEKFNKVMSNEHHTLQQSFTKLCMQWIEYVASDEYRFDGRNEDSHEICKKIIQGFDFINVGYDGNKPSEFLPLI